MALTYVDSGVEWFREARCDAWLAASTHLRQDGDRHGGGMRFPTAVNLTNGETMKTSRLMTGLVAASAAVALAGCSANLTASPESIATTVEDTLEEQFGIRPIVDCGEESIDLVVDNTVVCALSTEGDPTVYDTDVTFTEVDGTDYSIDIAVAEEPRS